MTKTAQTNLPDSTVEQAVKKMHEHNIGLQPVGERNRIPGVVTDRDLAVRVIAEGRHSHLTTVRNVMTHKTVHCYDVQTVTGASKAMEKNQLRRLIITTGDDRFAGVLTITDLALKVANEKLPRHVLHKVAEHA